MPWREIPSRTRDLIDRHRSKRELPEGIEVVATDSSKRVNHPRRWIADFATNSEVGIVIELRRFRSDGTEVHD